MAALYGLVTLSSGMEGTLIQTEPKPFDVNSALVWVELDAMNPQPAVGWTGTLDGTTWSFAAPPAPPAPTLTLAQQAGALIAGGLAITSQGTPALTSTYPCDPATVSKIYGVQLGIASGVGLPGGASTIPWKDSGGNWHSLTAAQFTALAAEISSFVTACQLCIDGLPGAALPAATATIP